MAEVLKVPPTEDFRAFQGLVDQQSAHLARMVTWADKECADTDGLQGELALLQDVVPKVAEMFDGKFRQCQAGMGTIRDKVATVDKGLRTTDERNAAALQQDFPDQIVDVPDISTLPAPSRGAADFADEDIVLKKPSEPGAPSSSLISSMIAGKFPGAQSTPVDGGMLKKMQSLMHKQLTGEGNDIWIADKAFHFVTGKSFINIILKPLAGDWDRLEYLREAYDTLGDACYTVAGNLRKGSWKIGGEWEGATATAFDSYMFRWANGIGGLGDAAKVISDAYKTGYTTILSLLQLLVSYVSKLIDNEIKKLAEDAAKTAEVDGLIEIGGLGPEDPLADGIAAIWTAARMVKLYQDVRMVVNGIEQVQNYYNDIQKAVQEIKAVTEKVQQVQNSSPKYNKSTGSLIEEVEQNGFDFEKHNGWPKIEGMSRVSLLPPG